MVVFPYAAVAPHTFKLDIPHRQQTHSATVVWRDRDRLGVALSPLAA